MKKSITIIALCVFLIALAGCRYNAPLANLQRSADTQPGITQQQDVSNINTAPAETSVTTAAESVPPEQSEQTAEIVEIKEKMFVAQSNDVYYNAPDYLGKTIKYEGMFNAYTDPMSGITYYSVIRYGPGCCGVDANCGFEVIWAGDSAADYPEVNDWVEAVGVLEQYEENGMNYLRLDLTSLTVMETRGAEYVTQ